MIHLRVRAGRLHRVHKSVYAVGHRRLTQRGRWMAAVLAGADDAVLSHRSAAALWQILPPGRTHVTTPRILRDRDGISFHTQSLQLDEVTIHHGVPVTTVARTLLDIAASEPRRFASAYNEAEYRRLTSLDDLAERYPGRRGIAAIRRITASASTGRTRFELEHRFRSLVEKQGLPIPEFNADLELAPGKWIQADALWRRAKLVVELDGRAAHLTTTRFDDDRERDRLLVLAGYTVIRLTWKHLAADSERIAADLRRLIA